MKNIFEIKYEDYLDYDFDDMVRFNPDVDDIIHYLRNMTNGLTENDYKEFVNGLDDKYKEFVLDVICAYDIKQEFEFEEIKENLLSFDEDYLDVEWENNFWNYVIDFTSSDLIDLINEKLLLKVDAKLGWLGYNRVFTIYQASDEGYAKDIASATSFYVITQYDEKLNVVDSLGQCYLSNLNDELEEYLEGNFLLEDGDIYILNTSDDVNYLDRSIFKIIEAEPTDYNFREI